MCTRFFKSWRLFAVLATIVLLLITPGCITIEDGDHHTSTNTPPNTRTNTPTITNTAIDTVTTTPTSTPISMSCVLTISANGNGNINPPVGVYRHNTGDVVNITATPAMGWKFVNWSGDVANANSPNTTVIMNFNKTVTANFEEVNQHTLGSNETLGWGNFIDNQFTIQAGKTVTISWSADSSLYVWVLTQSQYDYFSVWGTCFNSEKLEIGKSGTLLYQVRNTDKYHLVIHNPWPFNSIKVYSAVASW